VECYPGAQFQHINNILRVLIQTHSNQANSKIPHLIVVVGVNDSLSYSPPISECIKFSTQLATHVHFQHVYSPPQINAQAINGLDQINRLLRDSTCD